MYLGGKITNVLRCEVTYLFFQHEGILYEKLERTIIIDELFNDEIIKNFDDGKKLIQIKTRSFTKLFFEEYTKSYVPIL